MSAALESMPLARADPSPATLAARTRLPPKPINDATQAWLLATAHAFQRARELPTEALTQAAAEAHADYSCFVDPTLTKGTTLQLPAAWFDREERCAVVQLDAAPEIHAPIGVRLPFQHPIDLATVREVSDARLGAAVAYREALLVIAAQVAPHALGPRHPQAAARAHVFRAAARLMLKDVSTDQFAQWHRRVPLFGEGSALRAIEAIALTASCQRALAMHLAVSALDADLDSAGTACAHLHFELAAASVAVTAQEALVRNSLCIVGPFYMVSDARAAMPLAVQGLPTGSGRPRP